MKLTVIIQDVAMFKHLQEPVNHRSVQIELTDVQINKLKLRHDDEHFGQCFIEPINSEG